MGDFKLGRYRHFKGTIYTAFAVVTHTETKEEIVCYHDKGGSMWGRPKAMFTGTVEKDGKVVPRFEYVGPPIMDW